MAKFDKDGGRVPTNLFECAAWHKSIIATCNRCRREEVFDPHQLWGLFEKKRWNDELVNVARRLKCSKCRGRGRLTLDRNRAATISLPWPDEREWKRAINRFRS